MNPDNHLLIHINDQRVQVESGLTILQAARQSGIDIPTLCDYPGLPAHGSCRLCIVEIQGRPNTPTACTTPVEAGMVIYTHSPKVESLRTELIQMLLAEHPSGCLFCPEKDQCDECMVTLRKAAVTTGCGSCPKDEQCELQALAEKYGIEKSGYPIRYRMLPVEKHDPFFDRDSNLCILCGRCVRVCEDLHFANALAYTSRGSAALIGTAFQQTHLNSGCTFCGSCIEACPTGALSEKTRKWDGKPERETATTCPFCSIGCQINLLTKNKRVLGSLPNRCAGSDVLCVKGRFGITELVNHATRLKHPLKYTGSAARTPQKISWEEAVRRAAEKLAACPPERFEMQISADCSNEDLFVARQFARDVMKSGNIRTSAQAYYGSAFYSAARLLQESVSLELIGAAAAVLCLGLDDRYAQSVVGVHLHRAKKRGVKIIQFSSRQRTGRDSADVWLYAGPNQQAGLIQNLVEWPDHEAHSRQEDDQEELAEPAELSQAAGLLLQASAPLILLGPGVLANHSLLHSVELLIRKLGARVITLPEQTNLAGALRLGLCSPGTSPERQDLDVMYLIGEAVPALLPALSNRNPLIISHTMLPPAADSTFDLPVELLPTTAFSEEHGTYIDYAGRVQTIHPAVAPPGEALPSWMILSRIACQMGVPGFAYTCVEDIWQAAQAEFPGFPDIPAMTLSPTLPAVSLPASAGEQEPGVGVSVPSYMGIPLVERVAGLRSLYRAPGSTKDNREHP